MWQNKEDEGKLSSSLVEVRQPSPSEYDKFRDRLSRSTISATTLRVKFAEKDNQLVVRPCRKVTEKDKKLLDLLQVKYN
jgi:hypothetical protein